MAPKPVASVEYNHNGTWVFAIVEKQSEGGPGNYNLLAFTGDEPVTPVANVQQGTGPGNWR